MDLSTEQMDTLANVMVDKLKEVRKTRTVEQHVEDHIYVKQLRTDDENLRKSIRKIIESSLIWALPVFLGLIGLALWQYLVNAVKNGG